MKLQEFRKLIREEVRRVVKEHRKQTFESFLNEAKIDTFTITVGKHKSGHNVMTVHYWDEERHLQDYLDSADKKDKHYEVSRSKLDSKIAELKKEFNIKDKDIFRNY